ncbi:MAG: hypothetical protein B6U75_00825 [Desulfurococcales archaeon ex4484_217_1]|nr:MAG: hypothetical protein B6U76_03775 [Desulfurococcales archaeon ex4484_217_2]OYT60772.1 MAG: hypothetical protein B6U75_00825 [Desulfurococcales archaeon ex4484_217_1]
MSIKFLLKILLTLVLLDFIVLIILEKYLRRGFLEISFNVNIYSFEFSIKLTTWVFLAIFAALALLAFFLIRKVKK